mgnify:CR=1 FL=1
MALTRPTPTVIAHDPSALAAVMAELVEAFVTELPQRWDAVTQMHHLAGPKRIAVPVAKVDQHHQRKLKAAD